MHLFRQAGDFAAFERVMIEAHRWHLLLGTDESVPPRAVFGEHRVTRLRVDRQPLELGLGEHGVEPLLTLVEELSPRRLPLLRPAVRHVGLEFGQGHEIGNLGILGAGIRAVELYQIGRQARDEFGGGVLPPLGSLGPFDS
jgi:hypothetical protein